MTTLLQTATRQAPHVFRGGHIPAPSAASLEEVEYQTIYALVVALLAGGLLVTLTGLAHAFG